MRCLTRPITAAVVAFGMFVSGAGCSREQAAAPPVEKTPKARSKFFTQVADQNGPAALVNRLQSKFPDVEFTGGQAGPAGGGGWTQVEVVVVVGKHPPKFSEDLTPLLTELEQYCRTLAESNGAEIQGKIQEQRKDGKKEGFKFEYTAQADSGLVRVSVPGRRILLTVSERE
jgi:hypothetical protein